MLRNGRSRWGDASIKSRKSQFWDHFSWYAVPDRRYEADIEALLLRMLPLYLRSLNKQRTQFASAERLKEESPRADVIQTNRRGPNLGLPSLRRMFKFGPLEVQFIGSSQHLFSRGHQPYFLKAALASS